MREPDEFVELVPIDALPPSDQAAPAGPQEVPIGVPHPRLVERAKERAAQDVSEGAPSRRSAQPRSGQGFAPLAEIFNGLNEPGLSAGNSSPPDTTGAIGPNDYIEMVNSGSDASTGIALYNRSTLASPPVAVDSLRNFVGSPAENAFDPQIKWDPQANRFFYVTDRNVGGNFLMFGWSKDADPDNLSGDPTTGDWCKFALNTGAEFHDYPKLGNNDNHFIIGANSFTATFVTAVIWAIPKPASGDTSCTAPTAKRFGTAANPLLTADGDPAFTPEPANTFAPAANGYVVASDFFADAEIMAWHVSGPAGSESLTEDGNIAVSSFGVPPNVPQPGTAFTLDSLDSRLTQAQADIDPGAGDQLAVWTQHTIAGGAGSMLRWYELLPGLCSGGSCPAAARPQEGEISNGSHFVFNGAISPSDAGDGAVVNYNVGSATLLADVRARSRDPDDMLGQMPGTEITLGSSSTFNQDFTCTPAPCRWGDYSGASPDPLNPNVVWGSNQLNGPFTDDPHWITRNFALLSLTSDIFPPSTLIASGPADGSTIADSTPSFGFLATEAGATFECRIDAAVFGACSGPGAAHTTAPLSDGTHTFQVRAADGSANVDRTPASRTFTVASSPPPQSILTLDLSAKRKQEAERLRAKATCSLDCKLTLKARGKADRRFKSRKTTKRLDAGEKTRVKVRFKRRVLRRIDDEKGRARLIGKATAAGQTANDRLRVKLKP